MIPKIIHYVWVGDNPKPDLVLKCIESWKKYCPDYEIIEWNNNDVATIDNQYMKEAFECKKWAFVSDYLRVHALKEYGGFYFDTDLELKQPIDEFRNDDFVAGYEKWQEEYHLIATSFIGAVKNNKIINDMYKVYKNIHFLVDGKMDQTTNVKRFSEYLSRQFNLKTPYDGTQKTRLCDKHIIYPSHYFCAPEDNKVNYAIHHFVGSWIDDFKIKTKFSIKFRDYTIKLLKIRRRSGNVAYKMSKGKVLCSTNLSKSLSWMITAEKGE